MKYFTKISFMLLILFLTLVCKEKQQDEVFATFKDGTVTKSELKEFYMSKDYPINSQTATLKNQIAAVENIALQKIVEKEQQKSGLFDSKDYKNVAELIEKQIVFQSMKKSFTERSSKSNQIEFAQIQFVFIAPSPNSKEKANKVMTDLSNLKNDPEIFEYISQNTEEPGRKAIGGLLEPFCTNCGDNSMFAIFTEGINSKTNKFFVAEEEKATYVYRVLNVQKIPLGDISNYFKQKFTELKNYATAYIGKAKTEEEKKASAYYAEENDKLEQKIKMTSDHYSKNYETKLWKDELDRIKKEINFQLSEVTSDPKLDLNLLKEDTVLFSDSKKTYTLKEFNADYEKLASFRGNNPDKSKDTYEKLNLLNGLIIPFHLVSYIPEYSKIKETDSFKSKSKNIKRELAFNFYQKKFQDTNFEITDNEIKENYEASKAYAHSIPNKKDPSKKDVVPFEQVKDKIKNDILNTKRKDAFEKSVTKLKTDYELKTLNDKMKEGNI